MGAQVIDRKGRVLRQRESKDLYFTQERHRRLALRGSPATARGCGELWRALLAAAVAVSETNYEIDRKDWGGGKKQKTKTKAEEKRPQQKRKTKNPSKSGGKRTDPETKAKRNPRRGRREKGGGRK